MYNTALEVKHRCSSCPTEADIGNNVAIPSYPAWHNVFSMLDKSWGKTIAQF
jgi:hypothetical protein